tara:strand:+ start:229 stop:486 length:258 start_codon:yes stop_codon:yes gene_type:complete
MAITEQNIVDKIDVVNSLRGWWNISIRTRTVVKKDNVEIASSLSRRVISPVDSWSNETSDIQAVCNQYHTSSAITAYRAAIAARG